MKLARACEGHGPTIASVLGITPRAALFRLQRRDVKREWETYRKQRRVDEEKAKHRRAKWRQKLLGLDLDPLAIETSDPAWPAFHRLPRGALVLAVATLMRQERPGVSLATDERLAELLARVAVLSAQAPGAPAVTAPDPRPSATEKRDA